MPNIDAWKSDSAGHFFEIQKDARKDYSMDITEELPGEALQQVQLTLDAAVTLLGAVELAGKVAKFWLVASGARGVYACSAKFTGAGSYIEIVPFRVVIL